MRSATKKKTGKDKAYLAWLHTLPCAACWKTLIVSQDLSELRRVGWTPSIMRGDGPGVQESITEAAHVGERGMSQKCPDRQAIPLCKDHHTERRDSAHKLQKRFWEHHGIDKDALIAALNSRYEEERAAA